MSVQRGDPACHSRKVGAGEKCMDTLSVACPLQDSHSHCPGVSSITSADFATMRINRQEFNYGA